VAYGKLLWNGNGPSSGSVKGREFPDHLSDYQFIKKDSTPWSALVTVTTNNLKTGAESTLISLCTITAENGHIQYNWWNTSHEPEVALQLSVLLRGFLLVAFGCVISNDSNSVQDLFLLSCTITTCHHSWHSGSKKQNGKIYWCRASSLCAMVPRNKVCYTGSKKFSYIVCQYPPS
jgi:hypothetical protein